MSAHEKTTGPVSQGSGAGDGDGSISNEAHDLPTDREQLAYIEDMALELKQLAERAGHAALGSILDIAHREARLRRGG